MKIDKAEIRRKNMIDASQYPYQTPVIVKYDSGDPKACLEKALEVSDWGGFAVWRPWLLIPGIRAQNP